MRRTLYFGIVVFTVASLLGAGQAVQPAPRLLKNVYSLVDINNCENVIKLNHVRTWNSPDETDENKVLYEPRDIIINDDGDIFILESNKVKVFNRRNEFIRSFGHPGSGPGDLWNPLQLEFDKKKRLIIQDAGNNRIQIINTDGKYLSSFNLLDYPPSLISIDSNDEIVMLNRTPTIERSPLWIYYDMNGEIVRKEDIREASEGPYENKIKHDIVFNFDRNNNLIKSFRYIPLIQKVDPFGKPIVEISYDLPFPVPPIKTIKRREGLFVDAVMVCQSMAVDSFGRIFILTLNREKSIEERKIGVRIGTLEKMEKLKPKIDPETTNLYKIIIFNTEGNIISSNQIPKYANKIRVYKDTVYIIDTDINMAIYEYKMMPTSSQRLSQH